MDSVAVSPVFDTIAPGETLRLVAEAFDAKGHAVTEAAFTWSTSDQSPACCDCHTMTPPTRIPPWSPEGRSIAFQSYRYGNLDIYVMTVP